MSGQKHHAVTVTAQLEEPRQPDLLQPEPGRRRKRRSNDPTKPEPRRDKPSPESPRDPQDLPSQELSNPGRN